MTARKGAAPDSVLTEIEGRKAVSTGKRDNNLSKASSLKPQGKTQFAPLPIRAMNDSRLSARHFRAMMAIAYHDRFNRNGQGCWASRRKLAQLANCTPTHFSDAASDLRRYGYVRSRQHPMNRRIVVHVIDYGGDDRSQIQDASTEATGDNQSHTDTQPVPPQNANPLEENAIQTVNIFGINRLIKEREEGDLEKRDCTEAQAAEKAEAKITEAKITEAESYLSECEKVLVSSLQFELAGLRRILGDETIPEPLRERAARLRDIAE